MSSEAMARRIHDILSEKDSYGYGYGGEGYESYPEVYPMVSARPRAGVSVGGANVWTNFVKRYAKHHGLAYSDALSLAKKDYQAYKDTPAYKRASSRIKKLEKEKKLAKKSGSKKATTKKVAPKRAPRPITLTKAQYNKLYNELSVKYPESGHREIDIFIRNKYLKCPKGKVKTRIPKDTSKPFKYRKCLPPSKKGAGMMPPMLTYY